jgi:hypothetical protein
MTPRLTLALLLSLSACGADPELADEPPPGPIDDIVLAYCECMFLYCHDFYHATWGEDEQAAVNNCREEARRLPRADPGADAPGLECALDACQQAQPTPDAPLCAQARGPSTCQP